MSAIPSFLENSRKLSGYKEADSCLIPFVSLLLLSHVIKRSAFRVECVRISISWKSIGQEDELRYVKVKFACKLSKVSSAHYCLSGVELSSVSQ